MSAEFYIRFESVKWYQINHQIIIDYLCFLSCFVKENTNKEFWLLGLEDRNNAKRWEFDMHLFFKEAYI